MHLQYTIRILNVQKVIIYRINHTVNLHKFENTVTYIFHKIFCSAIFKEKVHHACFSYTSFFLQKQEQEQDNRDISVGQRELLIDKMY